MKQGSLIALTGGIASGKSRAAAYIAKRSGMPLISADEIAKDLFSRPGPVITGLRKILGDSFFRDDGTLDRPFMRRAIFQDNKLRARIDHYAHPIILREINELEAQLSRAGVMLVEVPLLFEAGWQGYFQRVIVVYADNDIRLRRLMQRDNVRFNEAVLASNAQSPLPLKVEGADYVIDNSGPWLATILQLNQLCRLLSAKNA